jgi:hypothetical protein
MEDPFIVESGRPRAASSQAWRAEERKARGSMAGITATDATLALAAVVTSRDFLPEGTDTPGRTVR